MDAALHAAARHAPASVLFGAAHEGGGGVCVECLCHALCAEPLATKRELFCRYD